MKLLEVTREVMSGTQTPVLSVDNKTLDMSSGFFDQAQVSNCSLNLYNLSKVMLNGVALLETDWAKFISFNTTEKKLTVFDYGRLVVDDQTEFKLLFQSRISATLPSLSDSYHLASVKVAKKVTILKSTSGGEVNNLP